MVRIHEVSLISLVALVGNGEMHVNMWFLSKRILWWLEYMLLKLVWGSLMNINWKVLHLLCEDFLVFQGFICHCVPALHLLVWCRIMRMSFCFVRQLATGEALEMLRLALLRVWLQSVWRACCTIHSASWNGSYSLHASIARPSLTWRNSSHKKLEVARLIQPINRNPTATVTILVWIFRHTIAQQLVWSSKTTWPPQTPSTHQPCILECIS